MKERVSADRRPSPTDDATARASLLMLAQALLFGVAYFGAAQIADWFSLGPSGIATVWPPAGLYLGVLLRVSPRRWPLFIAAATLASIVFALLMRGLPLPAALGVSLANGAEAVIGAGVLRLFWFRSRRASFATVADVLVVSAVAGLGAPFVGTALAAAVMNGGVAAPFAEIWTLFWVMHAVGVLLVSPFILVLPPLGELRAAWARVPVWRHLEAAAMLAVVAACGVLLFMKAPPGLSAGVLAFPLLLWPALRIGPLGVAAAVAALALIAIHCTGLGYGPFADPGYGAEFKDLLIQVFIGVTAATAHVLAVVTVERRSALTRLTAFNAELERRVVERTAKLRESEERAWRGFDELRSIYDTAPVGLCIFDRDLRYVRVNDRMAQFKAVPASAHIGRTLREMAPGIADPVEIILRRVLATGEPAVGIEMQGEITRPGVHRAWKGSYLPLRDKAGAVIGINVVVEEVTERRAAEAELQRLNATLEQRIAERTAELEATAADRARLASVAENAPDFIGICGLDLRIIYVNPAGRRLIGIESDEELQRWIPPEYFVPEERARVEQEVFPAVLERGHWTGELTFQHFKTGARVPVLYDVFRIDDPATGKPTSYATVTRDLRELKEAEEQLRQAQKMEAVGQLTGGVAHDFNNLLTAILGNLELLEKRSDGDEVMGRMLRSARHAAERGAELTAQLLAFSRKQHLQPKATDINELVTGMGDLLQHTIGGLVRIERTLAAAPWPVLADASQIELAVLNLAINARDAMPLGGSLAIETANLSAGDPEAPATLPQSDYVMISVSDTGTGMSEDVLAKAFEPFFTTKEIGKGSGLGLSMVLGVAQQHGGGVEITSRLGRGTTVRLYLPRMAAVAATASAEADASGAREAARLGCVLVVDDDQEVREFTAECLLDLGHRVLAAASGRAALEILDSDETIDIALVDLAMPGMSGAKFATAARLRRPELHLLFMTGYPDTSLLHGAPDTPVIRKPFRIGELAARVAEALAAEAAPSNVLPLHRSRRL